jgi:hypothetical protein
MIRFSFKWVLLAAQALLFIIMSLAWHNVPLVMPASRVGWTEGGTSSDVTERPYVGAPCLGKLYSVLKWDVAANLPAAPILIPLHVLLSDNAGPFEVPFVIVGFGIIGLCLWFFIGVFLDDLLAALRKNLAPRRHILDNLVSVFIIVSSGIVFANADIASLVLPLDKALVRICSVSWLVVGCTAITLQFVWPRRVRTTLG